MWAVWILAAAVWMWAFPLRAGAAAARTFGMAGADEAAGGFGMAGAEKTAGAFGMAGEGEALGEAGTEGQAQGFDLEDLDISEIQAFLDGLSEGTASGVSFMGLMKSIVGGNLEEALKQAAEGTRDALFAEIRTNGALMSQIVVLSIVGAVFSNFSGIFGSGHVSETGFYVVYLLIMAFLAASFFASVSVAETVSREILEFMRALLPAYFLAVAMAGGAFTSSAMCGFTFAAIGVVQTVITGFLVPMMRVYMIMALAGNLYKEDMISKMTELLRQVMLWTVKSLFGAIVGFHVIQGLVLPQADALKNTAAMRIAQMIPGIGAGAGAVSQMVMGSGILIKNTAGAAAVVILLMLAAVPVVKLLVLMLLYYMAAAVMQPVCDKRLVACVSEVAAGHGMLLKIVGYSLALFAVTIAVLCVSTNAAYYAG